jgi:hypothetical protein
MHGTCGFWLRGAILVAVAAGSPAVAEFELGDRQLAGVGGEARDLAEQADELFAEGFGR